MAVTSDRRTRIADAVIRTLAERGSRGLTHRAVDEAADLPAGSTSYYVRTRADLLACAVPRLAELDAALLAGAPRTAPARALADLVLTATHGDGRRRTLARYELVLEAARRPDLRADLADGTDRLLGVVGALLAEHGATQGIPPDRLPEPADLLALVDGLLLAGVTGLPGHERDQAALERAFAEFLPTP